MRFEGLRAGRAERERFASRQKRDPRSALLVALASTVLVFDDFFQELRAWRTPFERVLVRDEIGERVGLHGKEAEEAGRRERGFMDGEPGGMRDLRRKLLDIGLKRREQFDEAKGMRVHRAAQGGKDDPVPAALPLFEREESGDAKKRTKKERECEHHTI